MEETLDDFKDKCYCGDPNWQNFTYIRPDESLVEYAVRMGYTNKNTICHSYKATYKKGEYVASLSNIEYDDTNSINDTANNVNNKNTNKNKLNCVKLKKRINNKKKKK